jgi:hypothetical protein
MLNQSTLKPWPRDAIMITCSSPERANRAQMESVNPGQCRFCGVEVVYDSRTMRRAQEISRKTGDRPVLFFCVPCSQQHDVATCDLLVDHSGGKSVEVFNDKGANL